MNIQRSIVCGAALLLFSAQTPAVLRHLEYSYSVDYSMTGESHQFGIGAAGDGISQVNDATGRQGKLLVDVVQVADDGGITLRVTEAVQERNHPLAPVECVVYEDSTMKCRPDDSPTDADLVVMRLLARGFVDPSKLDDKNHWQQVQSGNGMKQTTDYTITDGAQGQPSQIVEHRIITAGGSIVKVREDARIGYNRQLSVPVSVHDENLNTGDGSGYMRATVDAKLLKDSFAKP